jgi:hypothetical protein
MVKQPGLFSPKFGATSSRVFMQLPQNFAVEPGIHSLACWDRCFALQTCCRDGGTSPNILNTTSYFASIVAISLVSLWSDQGKTDHKR